MNKQPAPASIEWRDISGYEGLYQVSNTGQVRRLAGVVTRPQGPLPVRERILKTKLKNSGYLFVTLSKADNKSNRYIHQLVAEMFIGTRPDKHDVNHINGDKLDNSVMNLEYATRTENMRHARQVGLHDNRGEKHYNAKLTEEIVRDIRHANNTCGVRGEDMAEKLGLSVSVINAVIDGRTWRHVDESTI